MATDKINFEEDQQDILKNTDLTSLSTQCKELQSIQNDIEYLEEQVKSSKRKSR